MPTYEYECTACGQHIEVFQRFSEEALTTCGVCGGSLRKVFHPAGIVFKGSGFYATDNRSAKPAAPAATKDGDRSGADASTPTSGSSSGEGGSSNGSSSSASGEGGSPSKAGAPKDPSP